MSERGKKIADAQEQSAETLQKLKRRARRDRAPSTRKDAALLNAQVHQVTVQGMPVSLPWLSFMARRDG
jgi:hypothetical protein